MGAPHEFSPASFYQSLHFVVSSDTVRFDSQQLGTFMLIPLENLGRLFRYLSRIRVNVPLTRVSSPRPRDVISKTHRRPPRESILRQRNSKYRLVDKMLTR